MLGDWEQVVERNGRLSSKSWLSAAFAAALLVAVGMPPAAQADDVAATPGRAVRLSSVTGEVQLSVGGQVIADQALENAPLFQGTRVVTGGDGRAEVQFEDGTVARLSPNSSFTITVLKGAGTSGEAEVALEMGLGYFELQGNGQAGAIRVKFGDSTVTAGGFTVLRVNMDEPPGQLAVFSGSVHLTNGATGAVDVHGGQSLRLKGKDGKYALADTIEPDSWDSWNADRDQDLNALAATGTGAANAQPDSTNPAWSDLDANGNWYDVPGQGQVWSPYDASNPGWDPYGSGYWMWTPQFGYAWVSDNSWGYIPYSCGMWNWYTGFGWGWAPGMGGCIPWWNTGGYAVNVAGGPGWWHTPVPPRSPHRYPGPVPGPGSGRPAPVIAVNRHFAVPPSISVPARDRGVAVVIAGNKVLPLRALSTRPDYVHTASGAPGAGVSGTGGARPTASFGVPGSAARTVPYSLGNNRTAANSSASHSAYSGGSSGHSASAASHSSGGGGGSHVSSGGGGGGGGGGGHVSSVGGGGGGGGGGHK